MAKHPDKSDSISLRQMTHNDIPLGMRLKSLAGWNQLETDWEMLLDTGSGGNFVAAYDGTEAGTVTTVTYERRFSWIGMVLVDPAFRRRGIGTVLLTAAIDSGTIYGPVRLDATPEGKRLYDTLGFKDEYRLVRMQRLAAPLVHDAVDALADTAVQVNSSVEDIGARRLQTVMERVLDEISFDASDRGGQSITIDAEYVTSRLGDLAKNADLSKFIL